MGRHNNASPPTPLRAAGTPASPATATHDDGRYPPESLLFPVQVEKENFVIQELKNHLHQVLRFSENSLLRTKQEAEKQQKADFRASQARVAAVQQEILVLQSQFHNLVMENRDTEQALRKVPWGGGTRAGGHQGGGRAEEPGGTGGRDMGSHYMPAL